MLRFVPSSEPCRVPEQAGH